MPICRLTRRGESDQNGERPSDLFSLLKGNKQQKPDFFRPLCACVDMWQKHTDLGKLQAQNEQPKISPSSILTGMETDIVLPEDHKKQSGVCVCVPV